MRQASHTCFRQCMHVGISDALMDVCLEQEEALKRQKGFNNPSTLPLNKRRDLIGALGQNGIMDIFGAYGMEGGVEFSPYYNPMVYGDEFDFRYRGTTYDIKSTPTRVSQRGIHYNWISPWSTFLVSDRQRNKPVDAYVFAQVDVDNRMIHYAGVIEYNQFWDVAKEADSAWIKSPAHIIEAKELSPLEEIIV